MSANIVQKPSEEMEDYFIFESDPQISAKWGNYDIKLSGKWMMFYSWSIMDEKWEEAVEQYRSGKLTGKEELFSGIGIVNCHVICKFTISSILCRPTVQND